MASFHSVNFAMRPNKNVERKLIFEAIQALDAQFPLSSYRYFGLGSLWFSDFLLAHRMLGITDMVSVQYDRGFAERARYNRPYACIEVIEGDAGAVLEEYPLHDKPSIIWLDYESRIDEIADDLRNVVGRLPSGSLLIATLNSTRDRIAADSEDERRAKQEAFFRAALREAAPAILPADFFDSSKYPANLADSTLRLLERATRKSGHNEQFVSLFNFAYRDQAPMITVGGMVANETDRLRMANSRIGERFEYVASGSQTTINVPQLTAREKLALDQLLPSREAPSEEVIRRLGFSLSESQIDGYHRYYTLYPVFGEVIP